MLRNKDKTQLNVSQETCISWHCATAPPRDLAIECFRAGSNLCGEDHPLALGREFSIELEPSRDTLFDRAERKDFRPYARPLHFFRVGLGYDPGEISARSSVAEANGRVDGTLNSGLCPGLPKLRQSRRRAADLAAPIQLASAARQSKIKISKLALSEDTLLRPPI
jgi:hypothetical protein